MEQMTIEYKGSILDFTRKKVQNSQVNIKPLRPEGGERELVSAGT